MVGLRRASSKESQYELSIKLEFLFHYKKKVTARGQRTVQWMHAFSLYIIDSMYVYRKYFMHNFIIIIDGRKHEALSYI